MFYSSSNNKKPSLSEQLIAPYRRPKSSVHSGSSGSSDSSDSSDSSVTIIRYSEEDCPACESTKKAWNKLQHDNPNWKFKDCKEGECEIPEEVEGFPQIEIEVDGERKMLSAGWDREEILHEVEQLQKK